MPVINLMRYIVAKDGTWCDPAKDQNLFGFTLADTMSPARLMLRWAGDFVALTGPLRLRVTVQAENMTIPLALVGNMMPDAAAFLRSDVRSPEKVGVDTATVRTSALNETSAAHLAQGRAMGLQASTIYAYTLDIEAGQAFPFSLSEQLASLRLQNLRSSRYEQLGNNLGLRVVFEPAYTVPECTPVNTASDLPCDFAAADLPNTGRFFPVACEPCEGNVIGLPPADSVSLITPIAEGGCVRTRFFNGMFITREDLETEQRYHRLKSKLHNRAAGAGVVWGLGVGMESGQVCIMPGYGVDCCGNDLALTTTYRVDVAALLADPAARLPARQQRGAYQMHLLLEYVECPSDPRPVHGDPCSTDASRCEVSRIRESVRLRLTPPRNYDAAKESAPLQRFLDEVREVRSKNPLGAATSVQAGSAPFQLQFSTTTGAPILVRPSSSTSSISLPFNRDANPASFAVEVIPDPFWTFIRGTLSGQATASSGGSNRGTSAAATGGDAITVEPSGPTDLSLANGFGGRQKVTFSGRFIFPSQVVVKVQNWQAQPIMAGHGDIAPNGDLTFTASFSDSNNPTGSLVSSVNFNRLDLADPPCGEPCGAQSAFTRNPIFDRANPASVFEAPTPLPWLHSDPLHPGKAGDPKALIMATMYGWLAQTLTRERAGTNGEIVTARREIADVIYRVSWLLLFGVSDTARSSELSGTLHRLLEGWCDGLLWKGPRCSGDLHGIVIGCVTVEGGTIQNIDPFGGRRYVVHYPLLEHWGAQFGIAPPDLIATSFFSKLCCIASIHPQNADQPSRNLDSPNGNTTGVPAVLLPVGRGYLIIGDPQRIAAKIQAIRANITSERYVGTPEMIATAFIQLRSSRAASQDTSFTKLVLADFVADQTVVLLVPA